MFVFELLDEKSFQKYIKIDIVIIVANSIELEVAKSFLSPFSSRESMYEVAIGSLTYYCGLLGLFSTAIVKTNNQGAIREGAAKDTVNSVIKSLGRDIIIISAGVAFGLKKERQKIGDILVSDTIVHYDISRIGRERMQHRASPASVDRKLFNRFSQDNNFKNNNDNFAIHTGQILTSEKLIDNKDFRQELINSYPDAIGGEMEASGIVGIDIPSIMIKGISDWADGEKTKSFQKYAATNAFLFIKHILHKKEAFEIFNIYPSTINAENTKTQITMGAEEILRTCVPRLELTPLLESEITTNEYKLFYYKNRNYLFLGNNLSSIPRTLSNFAKRKGALERKTTIFVSKEDRDIVENLTFDKKAKISDAAKRHNIDLDYIEYVDEYIYKLSQNSNVMNERRRMFPEKNVYVDQKIYNISIDAVEEIHEENSEKGIKHFNEKLQRSGSLVSIVTGEGGIGKTFFLKELTKRICEQNENKKVIFLTSNAIISTVNEVKINSISDLFKVIIESNDWNYQDAELLELNFSCGNIILFIDGLEEVGAALREDFSVNDFFKSIEEIANKWNNIKIIISTREEFLKKIIKVSAAEKIQFYKLITPPKNNLNLKPHIVPRGA